MGHGKVGGVYFVASARYLGLPGFVDLGVSIYLELTGALLRGRGRKAPRSADRNLVMSKFLHVI